MRRAALPVTTFVQVASSAAVIGPTVAAPLLLQRLELGATAVGLFVALVYLGAMVATQLGAPVVRRCGPIRTSQLGLLLSACGLLLMAAPSVPLAALGAVVIGLGYGPITPASSQMLARTTAARHYAVVFSIKQTGVPLGGVVAGVIVPLLVAAGSSAAAGLLSGRVAAGEIAGGIASGSGAVAALCGLAAFCALGALSAWPLAAALDRERDAAAPWPRPAQMLAPMRFVAAHAALRQVAVLSFVFSMVQVSLSSYLVSLLTTDLRWTLAAAGGALAASQLAGVVGRIAWGYVADRWLGPRRMLMLLALGMTGCTLLAPLLSPQTAAPVVLALLVVFGATAVGWNGVYLATVARLAPPAQAGMATAGTLFFTFFGVVVGPPLFGLAAQGLGSLAQAFACLALPLACGLVVLARGRWG